MLSSLHRFHGHGSLKYVFKNGDTTRGRYVVVRSHENSRRRHSRIAVIVSKKVHKRAVRRNRIRRRVYEIVRHNLPGLIGVYDVAFIVTSPEVESLPHEELEAHIQHVLTEAGIYKKPL